MTSKPQKARQADVQVGQHYIGWGKTWVVSMIFEREGVVEAVNVDDKANRIRWPLTKFRTMERA